MKKGKLIVIVLAAMISIVPLTQTQNVKADTTSIGVTYQGHVENVGWQPWVSDGAEAGTDGRSLRVEALNIKLTGSLPAGASIKYQGHVQNVGWQTPVSDGDEAGTDGKGLRVEALKIALVNMPGYSIQYRAHVQNIGWQNWVSDGQEAGTDGKSLRIEAIEIRIVKTADGSTPTPVPFVPATQAPPVTSPVTVDQNLPVRAYIDSPKDGQTITSQTVTVSGWALSPSGVDYVDIVFDNGPSPNMGDASTPYKINRPDVLKAYPQYNQLACGFSQSVSVSRLNNGVHTLNIYVASSNGRYDHFSERINIQR